MHPNPAFRQEPRVMHVAMARHRGFGTLCLNGSMSGDAGPLLAHVPFWLDEGATLAELHLVRSNPIARAVVGPTPAVIAVMGPDGYVSPDWYGAADQVPTWNYVAVHLRGTLRPAPEADMRAHLDRVSAQFEDRLAPKHPWTAAKMTPETLERMMRQILPFRLEVTAIDGTWKLNQNKPDAARVAAAEEIRQSPVGHEVETLAALMKGGVPEMDKRPTVPYT